MLITAISNELEKQQVTIENWTEIGECNIRGDTFIDDHEVFTNLKEDASILL